MPWLSIKRLSELTGKSDRTIKRRCDGLQSRREGNAITFQTTEALPLIYDTEATNPIEEKARLDRLRADKVELDLAEQRAELLPVEPVAELWAAIVSNLKARLSSIPTAAAPALASLLTTAEIQAHLEEEIHDVLIELSSGDATDFLGEMTR